MSDPLEPRRFERALEGHVVRGEALGEGPPVVCAHGLTATRQYVLHGSRALPRKGFRVASYDARGHGASDPAPEGEGYGYEHLADDLGAIVDEVAGDGQVLLAGHSMGTHTIAAWALANPDRVAAAVFAGPASIGIEAPADALAEWDELAAGLERGVEGFLKVQLRQGLAPEWQEPVQRFTRARLKAHEHLDAVAAALREVPRSVPFDGLGELENLDVPALVVGSHDVADPGHPYAVAEAWAEALPQGRLISEEEGDAPLAWKGGKLSREIAKFAAEVGHSESRDPGHGAV